jgi:hypothetical protein
VRRLRFPLGPRLRHPHQSVNPVLVARGPDGEDQGDPIRLGGEGADEDKSNASGDRHNRAEPYEH